MSAVALLLLASRNRRDEEFSKEKVDGYVEYVKQNIRQAPQRTQVAMNNFVMTVSVSFKPLHDEAVTNC